MKTSLMSTVAFGGLLAFSITGCLSPVDPADETAPVAEASDALSAAWTKEKVIATAPIDALNVRTAINAAGRAVAVWDEPRASGATLVRASVLDGGLWGPPSDLSDAAGVSANAGAVVDPAGTITVFWSSGGAWKDAVLSGGAWSPAEPIPASPGFTLLAGVGVNAAGDVQIATVAQRSAPIRFEAESLVKPAGGAWGAPVPITSTPVGGRPFFTMNSSGQAMLTAGFAIFRSPAPGVWGAPQTITPSGGQVYSTGATLDAGGRGYFFFVSRYGGTNISTAPMGGAWSTPKTVAKFATLGSSVALAASSADRALVYGVDYSNNKGRAAATTDGGKTWGALNVIGPWTDMMVATGSDSGLYAMSYLSDAFWVATGSGTGTAANAWTKVKLAPNFPLGSAAISGTAVVAAWSRYPLVGVGDSMVGVATGTVTP